MGLSHSLPDKLFLTFNAIINLHKEVRVGETSFEFTYADKSVRSFRILTTITKDWRAIPSLSMSDSEGYSYCTDSWWWFERAYNDYISRSLLFKPPTGEVQVMFKTDINRPYKDDKRLFECMKVSTFVDGDFQEFLCTTVFDWITEYANGAPYSKVEYQPPPNFGKRFSPLAGAYI